MKERNKLAEREREKKHRGKINRRELFHYKPVES
jgi:hypothetical protein